MVDSATVATLTSTLVTLVAPHAPLLLEKAATTAVGEATKDVYTKIKELFEKKGKEKELEALENNPTDQKIQGRVEGVLEGILLEEPEAAEWLQEMLPRVEEEVKTVNVAIYNFGQDSKPKGVFGDNGTYIENNTTGRYCLGNSPALDVVLKKDCTEDGLIFNVQDTSEAQYLVTNNGHCLSFENAKTTDFSQANVEDLKPSVVLEKCTPASPQWKVIQPEDLGFFKIVLATSSAKAKDICVDLDSVRRDDMRRIQLFRCHKPDLIYNYIGGSTNSYDLNFMAQSWYIE